MGPLVALNDGGAGEPLTQELKQILPATTEGAA